MLVAKTVDLCLQLVWLLLLDHFNVADRDLFYFGKTAVAEAVAGKVKLDKTGVLVKTFKHHSLNRLAEEIICKFNLANLFVLLQSVD